MIVVKLIPRQLHIVEDMISPNINGTSSQTSSCPIYVSHSYQNSNNYMNNSYDWICASVLKTFGEHENTYGVCIQST